MNRKYVFGLFVIISLFYSCTKKEKGENAINKNNFYTSTRNELFESDYTFTEKVKLTQHREISIPIDSVSINHSYYPVYLDADTAQYYVTGGYSQPTLDFYNIDKLCLEKRLSFKKHGIEECTHFYIHNFDSMFIHSEEQLTIFLVNIKGELINEYPIPYNHRYNFNPSLGNKFFYAKSKLYFDNEYQKADENYNTDTTMFLTYDIVTNKVRFIGKYHPESIKSTIGYSSFNSDVNPPGRSVTGRYATLNYVINYSIDTDSTEIYDVRSKHQKSVIKDYDLNDPNPNAYLINDHYFTVYYDKYRNVYYHLYIRGLSEKELKKLHSPDIDNQKFSIIITDEKFNYIGETDFPENTYMYNQVLVTKEGLLINNANRFSAKNHEDKLSFTLFKLVDN